MEDPKRQIEKSPQSLREEQILEFWKENKIFEKSLEKSSPQGEYVFYDGPPFATGLPHYGHILAGTIKDVIPRFETMRGKRVRRKWGWDCHGLPIENLIEKELGLKTKKDIEDLGIEKFNEEARASVLRYDKEWRKIVPRAGRWVDMDDEYVTMDSSYTESVWWSFKTLYDKGLIYQGFKSMHLCPRCETTLANFEVNQGYKDITDISVYVKMELVDELGTFFLAWTTTPWTLPGNAALAVSPEMDYVKVSIGDAKYILGKPRMSALKDEYEIIEEFKGSALIGKSYKPLFQYYTNTDIKNIENGWKVYGADFVTAEDGTGVVHVAPGYGEDDLVLSQNKDIPFIQHVGTDGKFKKEVTDFAGVMVKPKEDPQSADVLVIKYLAHKGLLFAKEKIVHSYPHCWRCDTPLLNFASTSWFVKVASLKDKLLALNENIGWIPEQVKRGRFGNWLEGARDWAISRSRFWGAPLPVWKCEKCEEIHVVGSVADIRHKTKNTNKFFVIRHGEAEFNTKGMVNAKPNEDNGLTINGKTQVSESAKTLSNKKIDLIFVSDLKRARETADIIRKEIGLEEDKMVVDTRLREYNVGEFEGKTWNQFHEAFAFRDRFEKSPQGGETLSDLKMRMTEFLFDTNSRYENKNILIVSHDTPLVFMEMGANGVTNDQIIKRHDEIKYYHFAEVRELAFTPFPHNSRYELDLHRPYIDEIIFECECGGNMRRVPEVFDVWYESGSMPFAQHHYPFDNLDVFDPEKGKGFPADFIAEGIDQTRGWFYSLLVLSAGLFDKAPYKQVIVNGVILAEDGQKMSKRLKNYPPVEDIFDKYGADAMRYYLLRSPVVQAEDLALSEKGIDEVAKKNIGRLQNVYSFYEMYKGDVDSNKVVNTHESENVLDRWIMTRLHELNYAITSNLSRYEIDKATRPIEDFIDDLSTWYLRRSRDRFKSDNEEDKHNAVATILYVLKEISKLIAPFMPFLAEDIYQKVKSKNDRESVHLENWPDVDMQSINDVMIGKDMKDVRKTASLGLEARMKANIKVRQPLKKLTLKNESLKGKNALLELVKEEVNVKEIAFDSDQETEVALDMELDRELRTEGFVRELVRALQDMRKKSGLNPKDVVTLVIETDEVGKSFVSENADALFGVTGVSNVEYRETNGENVLVGEMGFRIRIQKITN